MSQNPFPKVCRKRKWMNQVRMKRNDHPKKIQIGGNDDDDDDGDEDEDELCSDCWYFDHCIVTVWLLVWLCVWEDLWMGETKRLRKITKGKKSWQLHFYQKSCQTRMKVCQDGQLYTLLLPALCVHHWQHWLPNMGRQDDTHTHTKRLVRIWLDRKYETLDKERGLSNSREQKTISSQEIDWNCGH